MASPWWNLRPQVLEAFFGRRRSQFVHARGSFPHWVLIGAEEGLFRYELRGHRGTAGFGDFVVCPPGVELGRWVVQYLTHHVVAFTWLDGGGAPAEPEVDALPGKHTACDLSRLSSSYSHLQRLEGRRDERSVRLKGHLLYDILLLGLQESMPLEHEPAIADDVVARAAHYLSNHLHEPISLQVVAASLQLTPVQLTRRFRQAMRVTPNQYLTSLRLQRARSLLAETNLSIHEIARRCGYRSGLYLSRLFVQEMQVRPGRFRRQQRL